MVPKKENKNATIVAYVPVLHEGYKRFFDKYPEIKTLYLIGPEIIKDYVPLVKDIRALSPELIKTSLQAWKRFDEIKVAGVKDLDDLKSEASLIVMPDEVIMHDLEKKFFPETQTKYDSIFLRWDKHSASIGRPVEADQTISSDSKDQEMITLLKKEANESSDFWRQIGAAIVKDGEIILKTHNQHVPNEMMPYQDGDPRSDFHKGDHVELSTAIHAEASLIAEAASKGITLEGAEIYATTFPCPPCAKLIAYSGIKKIYYADGYGVLDGEKILKSRGVRIVFVETKK